MKKLSRILSLLLTAAMAVTMLVIPASAATTNNLLKNGNASDGLNGWTDPDGLWKTDTNYDGVKAYDSYYFHPKGYRGSNGTRIYQDVNVKSYVGMTATLSAQNRAYGSGNDESMLKIEFLNSSGSVIDSVSSAKDTGSTTWHSISVSATVPQGAVTARASLYSFYNRGSEADSYFDNVSLTMSGTSSGSSGSSGNTGSAGTSSSTDAMTITLYLAEGDRIQIGAFVGGKKASSVSYSTSNSKIATVSSKGKIKGVKAGTATITVKSGNSSVNIQVIVEEDD